MFRGRCGGEICTPEVRVPGQLLGMRNRGSRQHHGQGQVAVHSSDILSANLCGERQCLKPNACTGTRLRSHTMCVRACACVICSCAQDMCVDTCGCVCMHPCMCMNVHPRMCVHACLYESMSVCKHVCLCESISVCARIRVCVGAHA